MSGGQSGRLIAVEGIDGCGKSTQARILSTRLGALLTFEPGATDLGAALRRLVLGGRTGSIDARTEALMMVADRAQHVAEVIAPAMTEGRWVVTDRFTASTLAYQGYGRGLDLSELRGLVDWATGGLTPDLTVLVDVPIEVAEGRLPERGRPHRDGDPVGPAVGRRRLPALGRRRPGAMGRCRRDGCGR